MQVFRRRLRVTGFVCFLFVTTAAAAHAQSAAETKCRTAIAKNLGKFVSVAFKDLTSCHAKRSADRLPLSTDCNDVFSIPGNKSVAAYEKARAAMLAACPDELSAVRSQYARCPSPHSGLDDDGATSGIDDFHEATSCVLNLAATLANGTAATVLGFPASIPSRDVAKCQKTIGKELRKRINLIGKVRRGCQADSDHVAGGIAWTCGNFDDGSIDENYLEAQSRIVAACSVPFEEMAILQACGQSVTQLKSCVPDIATVIGGGLVAEAYELPSTCKLGSADLFLHAGSGERHTSSKFEMGYNGPLEDADLVDGFHGSVGLACNDDCVDCQVTLDPVKSQPYSFCRCDNDPRIHCDTIAAADNDDCGGGLCSCMFAPPLPLSAWGSPTCLVNKIVSQLDGTADGGTGVATVTLFNTAVVYLGETLAAPCPVCLGDDSANDGLRDGTCSGGAQDGQTCDQNSNSPDFGPLSYDCQPGGVVLSPGLKLKFAITTVDAPQIATDLSDGANPVFCLQCSGDPLVGCSSNSDCAVLSLGTCSLNTGGAAHANSCSDGICSVVTSTNELGTCASDPSDKYCDDFVRSDGGGILQCTSNLDCALSASNCPNGSCGQCTLAQARSCFTDPFGAAGTAGMPGATVSSGAFGAGMAATLCVPATSVGPVDQLVGLPGPGRVRFDFDFETRCASDPAVTYEAPGGSNCP